MADMREITERFRSCDRSNIEEIIALLPLLQGQLDPTSFMAGVAFGRGGGGGLDATTLLLLTTATNNNNQAQASGTGMPTNSLSQILPLLLLLRPESETHSGRRFEVYEREKSEQPAAKR